MAILPRFYVYILYRPDGRPFYVGKGQGSRIHAHESFARNGYRGKRYNIIRKIWRDGGEVIKQKVFETDDQDEAYAMEHYLVVSIGRENLANANDGGFGNHGYTPSDEVRARISRTLTGRKLGDRWKANVQAAKIGKPRSEACKAKIREKLTGRTLTPEWAAAISAANKGKPWSDAERMSIPASLRGPHPGAQGEKHHRAILTTDQVREIRRLRWQENVSPKAIADQLGILHSRVKDVLYNPRSWQWLDKE